MPYKIYKKISEEISNNLPEKIDISKELKQLDDLYNQKVVIEDQIETKLQDTLDTYCDRGEFEEAKQFIHRCFGRSIDHAIKFFLFKYVITKENEAKVDNTN